MIKGSKHTPETRAKMSVAKKGLPGHVPTPETRAKNAAAQIGNTHFRGHKHTDEARAKNAEAHRGKHPTVETREKLGAALRGKRSRGWKGGRAHHGDGYVLIWSPNHPNAMGSGYVLEHRLVMATHLGRALTPTEVVHHGPGGKGDNRTRNLTRFDTDADHREWHREHKPIAQEPAPPAQ